ncbi:hypothetical protein ETI02_00585 [Macrococcoides canis]|nr:hypothetical protein ETI02_00585 [Macrococcus canis]
MILQIIKARKKPVEVDVLHYLGPNYEELIDFCGDSIVERLEQVSPNSMEIETRYYIKTLEGYMKVNIDDYIIKGVKGEFYPCKSDIFLETYEVF